MERNRVRARLVRKAEDYPWSSAAAHCGRRDDPVLVRLPEARPPETSDWAAWLATKEDEETLWRIRLCTRTGRPIDSRRFAARLEARLGRRLQAMPVGRPKKVGQ